MKQLYFIEESIKEGFLKKILKKFFDYEEIFVEGSREMKRLLEERSPDFLYVDFNEPVNGEEPDYDLMERISIMDDYCRLRVTNFKLTLKPYMYFSPLDMLKLIFMNLKSLRPLKNKEAIIKE